MWTASYNKRSNKINSEQTLAVNIDSFNFQTSNHLQKVPQHQKLIESFKTKLQRLTTSALVWKAVDLWLNRYWTTNVTALIPHQHEKKEKEKKQNTWILKEEHEVHT